MREELVTTCETTPSGVVVAYRANLRTYWVNGVEVPSVTQTLDVLAKPALIWWGQRIGVQGVCTLVERKILDEGEWWHDSEGIVKLLTEHKLTVNHVKGKAADRGLSVHEAMERWARGQCDPDPDDYPAQERAYVAGLALFIAEHQPKPLLCEVIVGSHWHGYAGRYDLLIELEDGIYLTDLKTSKGVYPTHGLQLAAYERASTECGYPQPNKRAVLRPTDKGTYEFKETAETFEQFWAVLQCWRALKTKEEK